MTRSRFPLTHLPFAALALILAGPIYAHAQEATTPTTGATDVQNLATFPGEQMLTPAEKQQYQAQMQNAKSAQERQDLTRALRETIKARIQEKKDLLGVPNTPNVAENTQKTQEKHAKAKSLFGRGASIYGERASHGGSGGGIGGGSGGGIGGGSGGGFGGGSGGGSGSSSGGGHGGGMR
ncbi:hypothetical protein [Varunaivibrio sulfuroxidans]|uniref:Uncharacterized protein n=1 Tax=Varunaivibrio sulfuroxidans TaxID=1773489 RepID=A0A4R3J9C6_9PROT|nr:hypothetical protein [Varunaivibrio sulfuroxidans]TCS62107.1 hypothetical protein EDD55_10662 [Varunaivibrio sulfuroxidans]WES30540.1 hypothetical protein P3M64_12995 [Varunaivibrio sulfuroxidans]